MTVQKKFSPQQQAQFAFQMRYCQHKVWIAMENGTTKTFYANDCSATWLAMSCGHIKEVVFSQQEGLNFCLAKEKYFHDQYRTLEIYRRLADNTWSEEPIIRFVKGKKKEVFDDTIPADLAFRVFRKPRQNFIGWDVDLVPISLRPQAPKVQADYPKQPPGMRSATGIKKVDQLLRPGSAGKYGFTR